MVGWTGMAEGIAKGSKVFDKNIADHLIKVSFILMDPSEASRLIFS